MRKIFIPVILVVSIILQGCSAFTFESALSSSDIASECIFEPYPDCDIYIGYGFSTDSFSDSIMKRLYGFSDAKEKCLDYTAYISKGECIWEIHIYRVASAYDNDEVMKMLNNRKEMLSRYENGEYSKESLERARNAYIFSRKNIVCMLITENNEKYRERICSCI